MKMNRHLVLACLFITGFMTSKAQDNKIILDYIDTYKELAIAEMQRTGVPASIKLAQGIHETMAGTSKLVMKSNNHFGIKCKSNWTGPSVSHDDDARGECFRKYNSATHSYQDHSDFLRTSSRYSFLFELDPVNYSGWANGLKKAGYATNPRYPLIIIKLIEEYHLQDYTMIALGKKAPQEVILASAENKAEQTEPVAAVATTPVISEKSSYPEGEFTINDTRVIFATKGTSYLSIAQRYNISLGRLFEFNDMTETEAVGEDELVYLQRKRKTGSEEYHTVKPGESLRDIAQQQAIRIESLLEYNWLKQGMQPAPGEKLSLRGKSQNMPRLAVKDNYAVVPASPK